MDNYKAAKRLLDQTVDWHSGIRACAHALIAIADALADGSDESGDEPEVIPAADLADLYEKNRGLLDELERIRGQLAQCRLERERLEKWIEAGARGGAE